MPSEEELQRAKRVVIEYDPLYVDKFIAIADALEEHDPDVMVEGNAEGDSAARKGAFEINFGS